MVGDLGLGRMETVMSWLGSRFKIETALTCGAPREARGKLQIFRWGVRRVLTWILCVTAAAAHDVPRVLRAHRPRQVSVREVGHDVSEYSIRFGKKSFLT